MWYQNRLSLLFVQFLLALSACGQISFDERMEQLYKGTVPVIQSKALAQLDPEQYVLLDVRSEEEYRVSHISKARLIIYNDFELEQIKDLPKETKIVVYCAIGVRSESVGEQLLRSGFQDVSNLYGGIFGWKNEGFSVVDQDSKPTERVHTYNKSWSKWLYEGEKVYE